MKKTTLTDLETGTGGGIEIVKDDDVYRVADWKVLTKITASMTVLHPRQSTGGHSHEGGEEEYYLFQQGSGRMEVGKDVEPVSAGDLVAIPGSTFHRVHNDGETDLVFFCVFETPDDPSGVRARAENEGDAREPQQE